MGKEVYLIRHWEAEKNLTRTNDSLWNSLLTIKGIETSQKIADVLINTFRDNFCIITSPLPRSFSTALPLIKQLYWDTDNIEESFYQYYMNYRDLFLQKTAHNTLQSEYCIWKNVYIDDMICENINYNWQWLPVSSMNRDQADKPIIWIDWETIEDVMRRVTIFINNIKAWVTYRKYKHIYAFTHWRPYSIILQHLMIEKDPRPQGWSFTCFSI